MMMGFNLLHRKLLNDTDDQQQGGSTAIPKPCAAFCDAKQNPIGLCPPLCVNFCDSVCKDPPPLLLPDAPPPITVTPVISHGKHFNPSLFLEVALAVLLTGFLCLSCYAIYSLCTRRRVSRTRRRSSARDVNQERDADEFQYGDYGPVLDHPIWYIRTIGLQPSVIGSISIVGYKKGDGLIEGTDCSICLTEFEEDESVRLLPKCSHAFHVPCIDTWLRSHTNCPMCRAPIVSSSSMVVPQQELVVVDSSNSSEETREGELNNIDGDIRNESSEHERIERTRFGHDCNNSDEGGLDGIRNLTRSVSSDSLSSSVINALSRNSDANKLVEDKQSSSSSVNKNRVGSNLVSSARCPSMERFTAQREPCSSSVKRSASCVFLPRYGTRRQSLS